MEGNISHSSLPLAAQSDPGRCHSGELCWIELPLSHLELCKSPDLKKGNAVRCLKPNAGSKISEEKKNGRRDGGREGERKELRRK